MIKKDELLVFLKKLRDQEERAIPIYTEHLNSAFFLSEFSKKIQNKLKETLLILNVDSRRHAQVFNEMIDRIQGSDQNVY